MKNRKILNTIKWSSEKAQILKIRFTQFKMLENSMYQIENNLGNKIFI